MSNTREPLAFAVAAVLTLVTYPAAAQPEQAEEAEAPEPTEEDRAAAREAYGRGQTLYRDGQYLEAEAAFLEAYEHIPNPVVLLGVAEARERAGKFVGAVEALEGYLAGRPDAPDAEEVQGRIDRMRAMPGTLELTSTPAGAAIVLDGEDTGEETPATFEELPPGEHTISLTLDGFEPAEQTVTVPFGETSEETLTLVEITEPEPEPEDGLMGDGEPLEALDDDDDDDDDEADAGPGAAVWATAGVAAAGLVAGTVLGFMALSRESEFDDTPAEDTADQGERFALFADVAFGVAAAGAITAIVLFVTSGDDEDEDDEDADDGSSAWVAPAVGPRGGGVSAGVTF